MISAERRGIVPGIKTEYQDAIFLQDYQKTEKEAPDGKKDS